MPGEDPFLTGQYVAQYSYNMQNGKDTKYLKLVSTAKHYMDYDQEGNYGTIRQDFDANVTMLSTVICLQCSHTNIHVHMHTI